MKFATIVSKVFEPALTLTVAFFLYALWAGITPIQAVVWMLLFTIPPLLFRVWALKIQGLDWDIHDRTKRIKPLLVLLVWVLFESMIVFRFMPPLFLAIILFFLWVLGFFLITTFWTKISGHTSGNALAAGLIVALYGWSYWPILLIVPLVAWARVKRNDHTLGQVILGAVYSWGVLQLAQFVQLV